MRPQYIEYNDKCMQNCKAPQTDNYPARDSWCTTIDAQPNSHCWGPSPAGCNVSCYHTETPDNNYIAMRTMEGSAFGDALYAEFASGNQGNTPIDFSNRTFTEYFKGSDKWQLNNLHKTTSAAALKKMHDALQVWYKCKGDKCP